uniref:Uncharacterized protein n=1 Tax=Apteryx owenii TaxID=8824 RepID=A0A8B9Q477_APTOW
MSKTVNGVRIPTKRIVTNGRERIETLRNVCFFSCFLTLEKSLTVNLQQCDKVLRWKTPQS